MSGWARILGALGLIAIVAVVYFIGRAGRGDSGADTATTAPPDPGYAALDAEVIETGDDGRERYRLNAKAIHQKIDSSVIELEQLEMRYRPGAQPLVAGEPAPSAAQASEVWNLTSDHGQVRANGDDIRLTGNVTVTGPAPGTGAPLTLTTETMRIDTPRQLIATDAPVQVLWSGHRLTARGLQADLKAGTLRLESNVHGEFSPR